MFYIDKGLRFTPISLISSSIQVCLNEASQVFNYPLGFTHWRSKSAEWTIEYKGRAVCE